jgi:hypothetical protein
MVDWPGSIEGRLFSEAESELIYRALTRAGYLILGGVAIALLIAWRR